MKAILSAMLVLAALSSGPAEAEILDLSTIKCKDFVSSSKENIGVILAWLNGYYKEENDPPIIDFAKLVKDGERLGKQCAASPEMGLITAADKLFEK